MSIIKGTQSGIYAKLTPTYIVSFGYTAHEQEPDLFQKKDKFISWRESERKFVFSFEYTEPYSEFGRPRDRFPKKFEYYFDTYGQLKILEQYWFSSSKSKQQEAFDFIKVNAREVVSFFGAAASVFARTIAQDLVPVQPMEPPGPVGMLSYMDFPIKKQKNEHTKNNKQRSTSILAQTNRRNWREDRENAERRKSFWQRLYLGSL